jgi:DNA invertase Pin-like site-specific DNA recombinase
MFGKGRVEDTLVVWRLDRLGRSLRHLIDTVTHLQEKGVGFKSLTENIDTTTSSGKLVFHIFGSLAEFEREIIRERTRAGLEASRSRGRLGGRPKALTDKQVQQVRELYEGRKHTNAEICKSYNISHMTLNRYAREWKKESASFYSGLQCS